MVVSSPFPIRRGWKLITILTAFLAAAWQPAAAEAEPSSSDPLAPAKSMGQPPGWKPYGGLYYAFNDTRLETEPGGDALAVGRRAGAPGRDFRPREPVARRLDSGDATGHSK
jgi:hypothetical protein